MVLEVWSLLHKHCGGVQLCGEYKCVTHHVALWVATNMSPLLVGVSLQIYNTVVREALVVFTTYPEPIEGRWYLLRDFRYTTDSSRCVAALGVASTFTLVTCNTDSHLWPQIRFSVAAIASSVVLIAFGVGVPCAAVAKLCMNRGSVGASACVTSARVCGAHDVCHGCGCSSVANAWVLPKVLYC